VGGQHVEEQEITDRISRLFEETVPILGNIYRGFLGDKIDLLKESKLQFRESLKRQLPEIEKLIEDKEKNEATKRFLMALPRLQRVALALDNLLDKMEIKVEKNILFTQKALDDIKQLMKVVGAEFTDVRDYCTTKNPVLKELIQADVKKLRQMTDDFYNAHQKRLLTGECMPKAAYLYIEMTDSLDRMAKELAHFASFADKT
jgi:phosphate:Na+ symporter